MKILTISLVCLLAILSGASCSKVREIASDYAIIDVNIISAENEQIVANQTVLVRGHKIVWVGAAADAPISSSAEIIDGAGKYLSPGFSELHAHIPYAEDTETGYSPDAVDNMMLFAAHGITNIRGMKGHEYHLTLKEQTASGEVVGPRIFTCGARLNSDTVKTVEGAHQIVKEQFEAGFDFVKIHRHLSPELFHAIADAAEEFGLGIAGHVPESVGIREALSRNYLTIDHFDGYMEGLARDGVEVVPYKNGGLFAEHLALEADVSKIPALVQLTKEKNTWMVPTAAWLERRFTPADPETLFNEPGMAYISQATVNRWRASKIEEDRTMPRDVTAAYVSVRREILKQMSDAGVGMLFGCDAPQFANVPGFSMHHEVKAYQAAGLSDWQILKMATINPAIFFDKTDTFGSVKEGLEADLVLLEKNPLDNMENLKRPLGVMLRGRWLTRKYFDAELEKIAAKHR